MNVGTANRWARVTNVDPGGAAAVAGFRVGDSVIDCNEMSTAGASPTEIINAIRTATGVISVSVLGVPPEVSMTPTTCWLLPP